MTQRICDSEFPWCRSDARTRDFYKLRVNNLSPTQFAVGKAEIQVRAGRMLKKHKKDPARMHDSLRMRPIPILVRGGKFYLIDHHDLANGLYLTQNETLGDDLCVYVKVLGNFHLVDSDHARLPVQQSGCDHRLALSGLRSWQRYPT